jgi:glutathione synthase/RimK-type ligase-like ATP-grasp enzyme
MVFREARWVNHPAATYAAENKPLQLAVATQMGFTIPNTSIGNAIPPNFAIEPRLAVKALDSFLVRQGKDDLFFYTSGFAPEEISPELCSEIPFIAQPFIHPKFDLRVTIVGQECFAAETQDRIEGDWRLQKTSVRFRRIEVSSDLREKCHALTSALGLQYGAIDLVRKGDQYYFLEINPTGEWAWLDDVFDGAIRHARTVRYAQRCWPVV